MELKDGGAAGRPGEFLQSADGRASLLRQSAYVLCGDWRLAGELVREALLQAPRQRPLVRRAADPDACVRRILLDEARDRWRRREKAGSLTRLVAGPVVPDARHDGVLRALLGLPFQQRATAVLRYLEGLSQAETAEVLGCRESTVKRRSSRALATLRKTISAAEAETRAFRV